MSRALICGSLAFDSIMVFEDEFYNHILPDQIHKLNISFLVPSLKKELGGVAGNIAYNLHMLGGKPVPMGVVGQDFDSYREKFEGLGITLEAVKVMDDHYTPQAYITNDMSNNQITAFHPGAMNFSHDNHVGDYADISIGIVGPDGREGMIQHAREFAENDIPFIFDPGQAMPLFDGEDLKLFIEQATWMAVNDYEIELVCERTGWSEVEVAEHLQALFVTRGSAGSEIFADGEKIHIPVVTAEKIVEPTGCGDAYRAGLLYGLMNDLDLTTTGRIASLMGSIKIGSPGPQNHEFTVEEFKQRFIKEFGYDYD